MATFVVGDVQGCFDSLMALVRAIEHDAARDEMWFVGDLVNRGPKNVEVLRWVRGLGHRATVVLGNHDLHLLGRAAGVRKPKRLDTLDDVLSAPDADELLTWVRHRPVSARRENRLMVHAGLLPSWSEADIDRHAADLEAALRGDDWEHWVGVILRGRGIPFAGAEGEDRLAAISSVFQRVRTIDSDERLLDYAGDPEGAPDGSWPWFDVSHCRDSATQVLFGHWSALGLMVRGDAVCLDTGCVWGGELTALELESGRLTSVRR